MRLVELKCEGFRCLEALSFRPDARVNTIRGDNAQGKTSILEALLYLATSKSHRSTIETDLVKHGEAGFRLSATVARSDRDVFVEANWWQGAKRFRINGVPQTRISDILGKVTVVFFSPEDVALVRGTAAVRRKFLDMELSQIQPNYLRALQRYRQALRQRNELVRQPRPDEAMLSVWDSQLVEFGSVVMRERAAFVEQLGELAKPAYRDIASGEGFEVTYRPDIRDEGSFTGILASARDKDLRHGMTTRGPHRDDIELCVEGKAARHFSSQGQQRTVALALKAAELELAKARTGEYPVLMLDDALSELDAGRSRRLFSAINPGVQCLATTTGFLNEEALAGLDCADFRVEAGRLERAGQAGQSPGA